MTDSLKFIQQPDGSYAVEWDPEDPKWSWMNSLTEQQIQIIIEQAVQDFEESDYE